MTDDGKTEPPAAAEEEAAAAAEETAAKEPAAADEAVPADAEAAPGEPEADPVAALQAELAELKDQLLRALAETENVRRRSQREREDSVKYAAAGLAKDLIGVADNLRRALDSVPAEALEADEALRGLKDGVEMVERDFLAAFARHGIDRIEPLGEKFDHALHEAMFEVADSDRPTGTVVQLLEPGYVLRGRLLRPARVGVARAKSGEADEHVVDTTV